MAPKTERIEVRLSTEHKALIEVAAALRGQSVSAFVVSEALKQARRVQTTTVTRRDWERFLQIADSDEAPTDALVAAGRRHPAK